ncbi:hypothetical protein JCM19294_2458 [Nonlabens tegetincola]|uniref:Uncharacterized protein n=1 Tax=Nonlabens tegetincola TaxID=323273 RepID=A0A090QJF9_9FLAO|nr:hypothetical protein JCM19294_2458 [Nonlabens tegetincola]
MRHFILFCEWFVSRFRESEFFNNSLKQQIKVIVTTFYRQKE